MLLSAGMYDDLFCFDYSLFVCCVDVCYNYLFSRFYYLRLFCLLINCCFLWMGYIVCRVRCCVVYVMCLLTWLFVYVNSVVWYIYYAWVCGLVVCLCEYCCWIGVCIRFSMFVCLIWFSCYCLVCWWWCYLFVYLFTFWVFYCVLLIYGCLTLLG